MTKLVEMPMKEAKLINEKALNDFKKHFRSINNEQWFNMKDGFICYFKTNDVQNGVYYDQKGRWQYNLKVYDEEKLPVDIRAVVKSTYFDFAITIVDEIQNVETKIYIVHLEDKTTLKTLLVTKDGDMDLIQSIEKNLF